MKKAYVVGVSLSCMAAQALAANEFGAMRKQLGIPSSVATVVDASGDRPQMILIQDIHSHPEVQRNIASVILYGLRHWGTQEILVEGSWETGEAFKASRYRPPAVLSAVKEGKMGGAEMAAAMAPDQNFRFLGLEDREIYQENVAAYEAVDQARDKALRELETAQLIGEALDAAPNSSWNLLRRLLQLRLKPAEYAEYLKNPFRTPSNSVLTGAVSAAEHFYELADARSRIFLERAQRLHQAGPQVLVMGGFHTAAMTQELRRQGISYVVLSPQVTQGGFDGLYAQGMHETVSALKLQGSSAR